ncbi:hypothetical protein PGT21_034091 [Puccinia graminis f. sp. tritici]|uniref:Uncharacterized protein n=1 Tax=Puccinia graminis f. sp. tritici TaxID=56615 RepID=A0A5B0R2M1_PUCGR|nr:hypothetical protein PGT21_034091 [Puccinia graminis f. sp. tritici]
MIRPWTSFIRDPKLQPAGTSTTLDLALPATFGYPSRTYATGTRESRREMLAFDWTETRPDAYIHSIRHRARPSLKPAETPPYNIRCRQPTPRPPVNQSVQHLRVIVRSQHTSLPIGTFP